MERTPQHRARGGVECIQYLNCDDILTTDEANVSEVVTKILGMGR